MNLLVLLLLTYHIRGIIVSLHERNFVLKQEVVNLWESGYFFDFRNYLTLIATMCLSAFPLCAFVLEWLAGKGLPRFILYPCIVAYLIWMLTYPVLMIQWIESTALSGSYLMMFDVGMFLKLVSFHHVMHDNRYLLRRIKVLKEKEGGDNLASHFGI